MYKNLKKARNLIPNRTNLIGEWSFKQGSGFIVPNKVSKNKLPYVNLLRSPLNLAQVFTFGQGEIKENKLKMLLGQIKQHNFSSLPKAERTFSVYVRSETPQRFRIGMNGYFSKIFTSNIDWQRFTFTTNFAHSNLEFMVVDSSLELELRQAQFENGSIATEFQNPNFAMRLSGRTKWENWSIKSSHAYLQGNDDKDLTEYSIYFLIKHTKIINAKIETQTLMQPPNWMAYLEKFGLKHVDAKSIDLVTADDKWHVWGLIFDGKQYKLTWDRKIVLTADFKFLNLISKSCWRLFGFDGHVGYGLLFNKAHKEQRIRRIFRFLKGRYEQIDRTAKINERKTVS